MKILAVDDDDIALAVMHKVLTKENHDVWLARDGEEALEILRHNDIRVVVSDWNMPRMDGLQLCQRLRSSAGAEYIYIIMVTSRSSKDEMLAGLWMGADDFIAKPYEPVELLVRLRNAERIMAMETTSLTLFSLAKLAESKDSDTGKHLDRIREYSRALTMQMLTDTNLASQVPPRFADLIYQTCPLHDIGKVGIPDSVLLKPDSLNDQEWAIMKRHAEIGADTLNAALKLHPTAEFLRMARDIAWAHHERWDGTGYPRGLKGDDIPLCARIVALADVYDAMTTQRVYKMAHSHDITRGMILQGAGKHFDPAVVAAFMAIEPQFLEIHDRHADFETPVLAPA